MARCEECRAHCLPATVELCANCAPGYFAALDALQRAKELCTEWEQAAKDTPLGEAAKPRYQSAYNVLIDKSRELRAALDGAEKA